MNCVLVLTLLTVCATVAWVRDNKSSPHNCALLLEIRIACAFDGLIPLIHHHVALLIELDPAAAVRKTSRLPETAWPTRHQTKTTTSYTKRRAVLGR
ncbi:hypothetical protein IF1G_00620 [Cordyceps javanica]|uniref:Secreted protein n=1 Tax=Cordyceps javanica TaxID=43265 RepID=A0A545VG32_9HYPO|nr:hypothetical protein IF1G_00620 [Cordyceps javanica]